MIYRNPLLNQRRESMGGTDYDYLLTKDSEEAEKTFDRTKREIKRAGREDVLENPDILDLGGGDATLANYLKKEGVRCVSIDLQKYDKNINPSADRVTGDIYQMPFADESFDIIISKGTLDQYLYAHDFSKLAPELARVLKERGVFHPTWSFDWDKEHFDEIKKYFKRISRGGDDNPVTLWEKI